MKAAKLARGRMRRLAMGVLAGVATTAMLAGCSTADATNGSSAADASGTVTKVSFWGWVPGLEDLVKEWNSKNPDIQVSFHRMTGDDGQKVEAAVDAGAGPDLVQLSTHDLPDYVISGRVQDITKYVSADKSNYTPSSWAAVSFDGKVYGVPQGIGPAALMYRSDIFTQYGIAIPKTWAEYVDAAKKLHTANPDVYIANLSPTEIGQWAQEIQQAKSSWYGVKGNAWTVGVNDAGSRLVAKRWQELLDDKLVTTEQMWTPEYWADVNSGKIASISYAAWFPSLIAANAKSTAGNWRVAPLPTNGSSTDAGDSGGAAVTVLKGAKTPAAAAKFASWLNGSDDTQAALIKVGGLFPSTKNGLASKALYQPQEFFGGQVINKVFAAAAKNTPSTWIDGPNYGKAQTAITDEFSKVVTGQETFLQALDNAQATTVADLKSRGLSVAK
jgi:multiple sugar transport system substrate-binding protein